MRTIITALLGIFLLSTVALAQDDLHTAEPVTTITTTESILLDNETYTWIILEDDGIFMEDVFPVQDTLPVQEAASDDFTFIFGERPFGPGTRAMKNKQLIWDAQKARFSRILDKEFPVEVLLLYQEWGMGLPVVWAEKDGDQFVAFPEARYSKPTYMPVSTVDLFPGTTGRTWHLESVAQGYCVNELDSRMPGSTIAKNAANCAVNGASLSPAPVVYGTLDRWI